MRRGRQFLQILPALFLAITGPSGIITAETILPEKVLGRYQQRVWRDQDGLPQNSVTAMAQTRDGYLWLGTEEGAVRFDGVRFTIFDRNNTPAMGSGNISALLEDHAGNLWMGTNGGGVTRLRGTRFTNYTSRDGLSSDIALCLAEDRAGNIWIGTDGGGLDLFRGGRFTAYTTREGLPDNHVWAIAEDAKGELWVGTANGLARLKDGRFTVYTTRDGLAHNHVRTLVWSRSGDLWIGTNGGGLCRFKDGYFTAYGAAEGLPNDRIYTMLEDREGSLWVGTFYGGIYRLTDGRFSVYAAQQGLPTNFVRAMYQDRQGNFWIGPDTGGLIELKDGRFTVLTTADGLYHDYARAVYEDSVGNLWVAALEAMNRIKDGKITVFTAKDGLAPDPILAIGEDRGGNIWAGTYGGGVRKFKDGRFIAYTTREGLSDDQVYSLLGDRAGNVWIGTRAGLDRFRDGHFTALTTKDGLSSDQISSLYEDRTGALWVGTRNAGMNRFKDKKFTTWTTKNGLGANHVYCFYEDREGTLWIGTLEGGLSRFKDGKIKTITTYDGLYDDTVYKILEDNADDFWMSCNKGIYRVSRRELNDFADGRIAAVISFSYGVADGMLSRECNAASPGGSKTRDGHLWFPTNKGVVGIDPQRRNREPPQVKIETVRLDGEPLALNQPLQIEPGQENLEIDYTALSWERPEQIRFKYQLGGLDHDWVEAGTRRTAYYSHLPPGTYTFRVTADNGEGVWSTEGKSLNLRVLPPFYRTRWFLVSCALAILAAVYGAFALRIAQLKNRQRAQENFSRQLMETQENERRRIATELHDGLGQTLAVIKNSAAFGVQMANDLPSAHEQLQQIKEQSAQAIAEVREIAYGLRPHLLEQFGLTNAINALLDKVAQSGALKVRPEIDNIDGTFSPDAEMSVYRVLQECVTNTLKHAKATELDVSLRRDSLSVRLEVRDNGRGIAASEADKNGSVGFGLTGMHERVRLLGGKIDVHSKMYEGTAIVIDFYLPENSKV